MAASSAMIWLVCVLRSSRLKASLESFVLLLCAIPVYRHSLVPRPAVTTPTSSLVLLRRFVGPTLTVLAVLACVFSPTPDTRPVSPLVLPMLQKKTFLWHIPVTELLSRLKCNCAGRFSNIHYTKLTFPQVRQDSLRCKKVPLATSRESQVF